MKIYRWLRGLMKASALTTVMFIMQACYGAPSTYQCEFILSGYVTDKVTGEPLEGISLGARDHFSTYDYITAETDSNGYFEILHYLVLTGDNVKKLVCDSLWVAVKSAYPAETIYFA